LYFDGNFESFQLEIFREINRQSFYSIHRMRIKARNEFKMTTLMKMTTKLMKMTML